MILLKIKYLKAAMTIQSVYIVWVDRLCFFVNREKQTIHIIVRASDLGTRFVFIINIINLISTICIAINMLYHLYRVMLIVTLTILLIISIKMMMLIKMVTILLMSSAFNDDLQDG